MTAAEKLRAIFDGELVDCVPFALKGWRIPHGEDEDALLRDGMGVLDARSVYRAASPNVRHASERFERDGAVFHRSITQTPVGELSSVSQRIPAPRTENTSWRAELPFKRPEDYAVLLFIVEDRRYEADYAPFEQALAENSPIAFFKTTAPGSPLHTIMYEYMGIETFAIEWEERRDEIIALHDAMVRSERDLFAIVARSPAKVIQCGGNYCPEVLGKERFLDYVLPHWEEVGGVFHEHGKLLGSHLDANNLLWAQEVGSSPLDWIEAFTPSPDTDMSVADARRLWRGKTLFINYPSSVHLRTPQAIREATIRILEEAAPGDRFVIGITENVPEGRWRESFRAILDACNEFGITPIGS
ncbi:hypothetical protein FJZ36_04620 [Candidatus Poribacteria bacterium]|nr:hypothetical protein [Candidatus Poribacteria bacterium]